MKAEDRVADVVVGQGMSPGLERSLTDALRAGDRQAADRLVAETYRMIFAALVRLTGGDHDLAADLTQETYRKAWASLSGFDGRARFSTWLYRIAYTTFLNQLRRPRLLVPLESPGREEDGRAAPEPQDPAPLAEQGLADASRAERLRRAVLGLPEDLRFTVTARYWQELSVREIATLEGITTVAVRKRLKRATKILSLALEEDAP